MSTVLQSPPRPRANGQEAASAELQARVERLEGERESLLELLAQQQRVAQMGLLASGLTHEINNHLQAISGEAFLALRRNDPHEWKEALQKVQEQCCAVTETTRAFLGFIKRRKTTWQSFFQVSMVIEEAARLTRRLAAHSSVTLVDACEGDAMIHGEQSLAVQSVVNLVSNAVRACGDSGGEIAIRANCPPAGPCRIEVSDNGPGIPDSVRRKLFRPFVTGEEGRGGNGLGLFIVRQAVRRLGGKIWMTTSSDGTTFRIELPRAR